MPNQITIRDFVNLTGTSLKTVLYYHQIGLLPEPERSAAGYRLYGPADLARMQSIRHLKSLGFDLKRSKEILGETDSRKTLRDVLCALRAELLVEKKSLDERIARIETLLCSEDTSLDKDSFTSPSFQMVMDILGPEQTERYARTCPQLFQQQRKVHNLMDDFRWGEDHQDSLRNLATFFQAHPQAYQTALAFGVRLAKLAQIADNDPEVDALAREAADFIKDWPQLVGILSNPTKAVHPHASLYQDMVATVISPAQIRYGQLLKRYLIDKTGTS